MANLKGIVETEVEVKATPEQFYNMWRRAAHQLPDVAGHIQAVELHDGDWDHHGAIKNWNYTIDGREETFKERLEFDDETKTVRLVGLEGDVFKLYKTFVPTYVLNPNPNGPGCLAKTFVEYEKLSHDVPAPDNYLNMAVSIAKDICSHYSKKGIVETEVEVKASPEQFYNMWRRAAHQLPDVAGHIQGVELHEGDWDHHGSIKNWNYTIEGRQETFKERLEFDDETKTVRLVGLEGDVFKLYKTFVPTYVLNPNPNGPGCLARTFVEYEKLSDDVPAPDNYLNMAVSIAKDICAHYSKDSV